ncbi:MAG: TerB family tellurite resistance protein [Bacteroidota bacterium]|nr:TerB family tellurite resistance protein [Bacteroidota bacterium]
MVKFGKWVGGGLGWAFGGPIGALLGFTIGAMFDEAKLTVSQFNPGGPFAETPGYNSRTAQGDFAVSLLVLTAAVMKSDGRVVKSELDYVKKFLVAQFGEEQTLKLLPVLKNLLEQDIPVRDVCLQIRQYMPEAQRIQLLHYLFGISKADGNVDQKEAKLIEEISDYMNIERPDFESVRAMYWRNVDSDYKILEVEPNATDDEVKKAFRRMAVKYHPDKVIDLGEAAQKNAKEKFQMVQEAYDNIRKKRGMV